MSLSTEELFEGFIALLILVVAFMMVKVTIAITVQYEPQLLPTFSLKNAFHIFEIIIVFARKK